ncbi:hypothetical protein D3C87_1818490 [compost metagenome]
MGRLNRLIDLGRAGRGHFCQRLAEGWLPGGLDGTLASDEVAIDEEAGFKTGHAVSSDPGAGR